MDLTETPSAPATSSSATRAEIRAEAQKNVAQAANRVSVVAAHAARLAVLSEPAASLPWVDELRDVADTLKDALEDLQGVLDGSAP